MTLCASCLRSWSTGPILRTYPCSRLQVWRCTPTETRKIKFAGMHLQVKQIFCNYCMPQCFEKCIENNETFQIELSQNTLFSIKNLFWSCACFFKNKDSILNVFTFVYDVNSCNDICQVAINCLMTSFPVKMYLFKTSNRNTRKGVKYVQS